MTDLARNLAAAHTDRRERARDELMAADEAPALFKPEWSERAMREASEANLQVAYWSTVGAR